LMGFGEEQLSHALALSAAHCATLGVVRHGGTVSASKLLAGPIVLQTGTLVTLLAAQGVTGPLTAFEETRGGLIHGIMPGMDPSILTLPIGNKYMVEGVTIKAYPGIAHAQAAIAAALTMHQILKGSPDDADIIEFTLNDTPATQGYFQDKETSCPRSKEAADHSFYFLCAVALLDGELTLRQFEGERWFDPRVCALMDRITFRMDKRLNDLAPGAFPCILRVVTKSGEEKIVEVPYAPGHPHNRLSASDVEEKFSGSVEGILDKHRRDAITRTVSELASLPSVEVLTKQLALP
jgi:2-methylcitrate dehydratase